MRFSWVIVLLALGAVGVLSTAVWNVRLERSRLFDEFASTKSSAAKELAAEMGVALADMDEDARLVAGLVGSARGAAADRHEDQSPLIASGLRALATVVRHYRAIALVGPRGVIASAVDPSESPAAARDLLSWTASAAQRVLGSRAAGLDGPKALADGRQVYVYAAPAPGGEVMALVTEARLLLAPMLKPRGAHVRQLLIDPFDALWTSCERAAGCRALDAGAWRALPGLWLVGELGPRAEGVSWSSEPLAAALGLPARAAVTAWQAVEGRAGGRWIAAVVASAAALEARERSLLSRLVTTAVGLAVVLGGIALFLLRHQKRSVALEERLRTAQQVAHLKERAEKIVENVPVGLVGLTRDGGVAFANRFLTERLGGLVENAPLAGAFREAPPQSLERLRRAIEESIRGGRPVFLRDQDLRLFSQRPGHFDYRVIPLERPAEDVAALLLIEDLSELKSLEKQLVRAEKLGTVGALTAGLAHEIGTPLGIIRGRAEGLLERAKEPGMIRDLEAVVRQIDQISSVIRQVLDFSRAQPVDLRPVEAASAVAAAIELLDWRFRQKRLFVRTNTAADLPPIAADPDQLQQVLVNLLINACDACGDDGTILVKLGLDGGAPGHVKLEIKDDGCGIPADLLNAVFDPFFTTKKRGEGTGLGLPVAASIVRNHRGEIQLASQPGVGTSVTLLWPMAAAEAPADREAAAHA